MVAWALEIALKWMPQNLTDEKSTSGNSLVPSGIKPLPEPMLTKDYAPYGITWLTVTWFSKP